MLTLVTDCEVYNPDTGTLIQSNTVRIHFVYHPLIAATWDDPADGGESDFCGAEVLGNQGRWIKLRPCDPLYQWAEKYADDNQDELDEAEAAADAAERRYDERRDEGDVA